MRPSGASVALTSPACEVVTLASDYDTTRAAVRWHDLIVNRCKVINDVTWDRAVVSGRGNVWRLDLFGRVLCEWDLRDVSSVRNAYERADAAFTALWDARRVGFATFGPLLPA